MFPEDNFSPKIFSIIRNFFDFNPMSAFKMKSRKLLTKFQIVYISKLILMPLIRNEKS